MKAAILNTMSIREVLKKFRNSAAAMGEAFAARIPLLSAFGASFSKFN